MPFGCPTCLTWTVVARGLETWTGPDGEKQDFVAGTCETCDSLVLDKLSPYAIKSMSTLMKAADIAEKVVANG